MSVVVPAYLGARRNWAEQLDLWRAAARR
jgi:hypothetical protein